MGDQLHDKREAICRLLKVDLGTREPCTNRVQRSLEVNKNEHTAGAGEVYKGVVIDRPPRSPDLT